MCTAGSPPRPGPRSMSSRLLDTVAVLAAFLLLSASGLQITELSVPTHADVRGAATLACRYNLQNATLNSVKWYKDEREFFRYTPGMSPPTKAFPAPGIDLDLSLSKSHDTQVTLKPLYYNTSGTFRCEVSADAPKFETVHRESSMTVMALPRENPSIQGVKSSYSIGQEIHANCTADRSRPPATLTWLVNGLEAHRYQVELYSPRDVAAGDGLQSTTLGLSLQLTDRNTMFPTGRLDLLCRASIDSAPSLSRESRKIVMLDQNQKLAQRSAAAGGAASLSVLFTLSLLRRHCS